MIPTTTEVRTAMRTVIGEGAYGRHILRLTHLRHLDPALKDLVDLMVRDGMEELGPIPSLTVWKLKAEFDIAISSSFSAGLNLGLRICQARQHARALAAAHQRQHARETAPDEEFTL